MDYRQVTTSTEETMTEPPAELHGLDRHEQVTDGDTTYDTYYHESRPQCCNAEYRLHQTTGTGSGVWHDCDSETCDFHTISYGFIPYGSTPYWLKNEEGEDDPEDELAGSEISGVGGASVPKVATSRGTKIEYHPEHNNATAPPSAAHHDPQQRSDASHDGISHVATSGQITPSPSDITAGDDPMTQKEEPGVDTDDEDKDNGGGWVIICGNGNGN